MRNIDGEILVGDNNSTDGSKNYFENKFPHINFSWSTKNEGFAKANNSLLQRASGDYILFLNPDTIVPEDCFEKCIHFIQNHNDNIACGIKMIDGSGKFLKESKRAFPSPLTSFYKLSGLTNLFPKSKLFSKYHLGYLDENINHEVDVLAGAFIMIPKKITEIVGGFDESFFMYGEDIDLSYRIQLAGYKNFYLAETSIIHFKGESTKKGSLNYVKMFYKAMSVFAKKHYGGTKAGVFNFFIQTAIFLRAGLSALARFLKWIGLPVIDAGMILMSFWLMKFVWNTYVKKGVYYSPNLILIAFPAFTVVFMTASYFAGLYDSDYRQSRLNKSTATAILVLLAAYSLLPESLRFSRGILLFGSLLAFLLMTIIRWLLLKGNIIEITTENKEVNQTLIAGTANDFNEVNALLQSAGMQERILGRVDPAEEKTPGTIGTFNNLNVLLKTYPVREIIFCESFLSFKKIIEVMPQLPAHLRIKFFATGTKILIGRGNKSEPGNFLANDIDLRLALPVSKRNKHLIDIIISLLFIITFPIHFVTKSKPVSFFKNVFVVLFFKKTWVGYALPEKDLPKLKSSVLTTTGLPSFLNTLPHESLQTADMLYAKNFHILNDIKIIWLNYKFLS